MWVEPYAHSARYTGMEILILFLILIVVALTYILSRRWKERKRREQEQARQEKDSMEGLDEYCKLYGNPYTAD